MRTWSRMGLAVVLSMGVGCDEHDHEHEAEPGDDACEHLEGGPIVPVTSSSEDMAPVLASAHTRYDITVGTGGFLKVPIGEEAEYYFFFSSAASLVVKDSSGVVVAAEMQGSSDEHCDLVGAWFVFDLGVGTYTLEVSPPAPATEAQLVFFEAGGHDHEH